MSRFGKHLTAGAIALGLSLLVAAANSQAQTNFYWAGSASASWADANQWYTTNGAGAFVTGYDWPADPANPNDASYVSDIAWFTNSGTFNVSVASPAPASFNISSNMFANSQGTVMNVTLNIGPGISFQPLGSSSVVIGQNTGATTIVTVTTAGGTFSPGTFGGTIYIGKNGYGVLYITNGYVKATNGNWTLGSGTNSLGLLVIANPGTYVDMGQISGGHLNVGGGDSYGHTVILSNSAVLSCPNLRLGCTSASGSSNNLMIVDSGAELFIAGGHAVVGNREGDQAGTNTPSFNNTLIFQNGGHGDSSNHTFAVGWADNDVPTTPPSTGNVVIIQSGCGLTNLSHCWIRSNNFVYVYGGVFGGGYGTNAAKQFIFNPYGGDFTNEGAVTCWGTIQGSAISASGGVMIVSNNVGPLAVLHNLVMSTGSVMQITLGSSFNTISAGSNVVLHGKINFIDSGGFNTVGNHTYTLFTGNFSTNFFNGDGTTNTVPYYADTNNLTIGTVPNPSATYTISLPDFNTINLIVSGLTAPLPFQITSIAKSGNDLTVNWNTKGSNGQFNYVQACPGGNYNTNSFFDIATNTIAGATASYTDVGGATNRPNRYYRIRSPQ